MKKIFLALLAAIPATAIHAQTVLSKGEITAKIEMIRDEEDVDASQIGRNDGGGGGMRMMMGGGGDMELETVLRFSGSKSRTETKTDMGNMTMLRDNEKGETYNLMSMMGKKTAMHFVDQDLIAIADSSKKDSTWKVDTVSTRRAKQFEVINTSETKKIAGYNCIKAYLVGTNFLGQKDSSVVWYTPDLKLADGVMPGNLSGSTAQGQRRGGGMRMGGFGMPAGLDKIPGLPMMYEMRQRNMTVKYKVTKIDTNPTIDPKEFEVPAGYEIMEMKDMMRNSGGGQGTHRVVIQSGN